jgi:hypothetical protein
MLNQLLRTVAVLGLSIAAVAVSEAQDPPPIRLGGLSGGPLLLGGGMDGPKLRQLIARPDVQRGLDLNLHQKNAIAELLKDPNVGRIQVRFDGSAPTDEETRRKAIEDQVRAQSGSLGEKVQKILKPEQYDRFLQLDLQWRGPLALADSKVAEKLKLSPESRVQIEKAAAAYRVTKQEVMMKLAERNDDGNGRVMVRLNTKELDNPQSPAAKQLSKAKQEAETQILDALKPEEKSRWNKAQGEAFTFRVDIPGNRF